MIAILPILTLGILLLLFVLLSRRAHVIIPKFFYGKRIRWTVTGYVIVLLIATSVFYIVPKSASLGASTVKMHDDRGDSWDVYNQLYKAANNGVLTDEYDQYIEEEQKIEVADNTLDIHLQQENGEPILIFAEKKDENDGLVDVTHYRTPTVVGGVGITDEIPPLQMETTSKGLTFVYPEYTELKYTSYQKEFPVTQFTSESNWRRHDIQEGNNLIFMRVPKDLELNYPGDMDVTYVEE